MFSAFLAAAILDRRRVAGHRRERARQTAFAQRLIETQEGERQRISTELHDALGQELFVIRAHVRSARATGPDMEAVGQALDAIDGVARKASEGLREIAHALRPYHLDKIGLSRTVEEMARSIGQACGIDLTTEIADSTMRWIRPRPDPRLPHRPGVRQQRREALRRSPCAGHEETRSGVVELRVEDDGMGFLPGAKDMVEPANRGLGLMGIQERAKWLGGEADVQSTWVRAPSSLSASRSIGGTMADEIRIVIAEDHPFFRDGLRRALDAEPGFLVVAEAGDGGSALGAIRTCAPHVAILDIGLPVMDGCAVVKAVREERIPVEIAFLTIADDGALFEQALEWDVKGYMLKDCTDVDVVRCVRAVAQGQHFTCPAMTTYLVNKTRRIEHFVREAPGLKRLTRQEQAILALIAPGQDEQGDCPRDGHRAEDGGRPPLQHLPQAARFTATTRSAGSRCGTATSCGGWPASPCACAAVARLLASLECRPAGYQVIQGRIATRDWGATRFTASHG